MKEITPIVVNELKFIPRSGGNLLAVLGLDTELYKVRWIEEDELCILHPAHRSWIITPTAFASSDWVLFEFAWPGDLHVLPAFESKPTRFNPAIEIGDYVEWNRKLLVITRINGGELTAKGRELEYYFDVEDDVDYKIWRPE